MPVFFPVFIIFVYHRKKMKKENDYRRPAVKVFHSVPNRVLCSSDPDDPSSPSTISKGVDIDDYGEDVFEW